MGRIYTIVMASGTIANASGDYDWFEVRPAANKPIRIRGYSLAQTSEVADAAEEMLRFRMLRLAATVTSGSGGTTPTPVPVDDNDATAGFGADADNSTVATTTGSTEVLDEFAWNIRAGPYVFWYPDGDYAPRCQNAEAIVLRMETTVADDITAMGTMWIEEL